MPSENLLSKKQEMYKVSYMAYNNKMKIVVFRKEFATAEERKKHLDELRSCGCLYAILRWSNPE